ncbi:hypothetical protein [Mucilaginibacter antarcticus]|uniref:Uncharacterized protein n=1 Tax=Mucilaginibacter antarcticus TaxID=1855725 RepID=A0ABW5XIC4_9SPHI
MKTFIYVSILLFVFSAISTIALVKLWGNKRYVDVKLRHEHGAVVIKSKKVRVPYTIEQTSIPTIAKGPFEFLFLKSGGICFGVALSQVIMYFTFILACYLIFDGKASDNFRQAVFTTLIIAVCAFAVSELLSNGITKAWVLDTKNGINGNPDLFGGNATFKNRNPGAMVLKYQFHHNLFIAPIIALVLIVAENNKRSKKELADYLNQHQLQ